MSKIMIFEFSFGLYFYFCFHISILYIMIIAFFFGDLSTYVSCWNIQRQLPFVCAHPCCAAWVYGRGHDKALTPGSVGTGEIGNVFLVSPSFDIEGN